MSHGALSAITSIDGRYRSLVEELSQHFSEFALVRSRVHVECEYLIALAEQGGVGIRAINEEERGVLRGLHYQSAPHTQSKLIRVISGQAFDVVVDIRKKSKTFGQQVSVILNAENHHMLFVPQGFAHGFLSLEDDTELLYKVSDVYSKAHERGIRWDDAALGIVWPKLKAPYILSEKDRKYPAFKEIQF